MSANRRLLSNSFALLLNRLTQSVSTFVLVAAIARMLGAYELGQYLLAFSYYFIFMSLFSQGFKVLFTRELARDPAETPQYLVSGTLLQLACSLAGYLMLAAVVFVMPYHADTAMVCYILGLAIIPFSLSNITEAVFQAYERMHLITISTVPIYLLRTLGMIGLMRLNYGVNSLAAVMVVSEVLIFLIQWGLIMRFVRLSWRIRWAFMKETLQAVRTFIAIEGIAVFKQRMQILILSVLGGEVVVGLYGAILQLMQPFDILAHSLTLAAFPRISKSVALGRESQRRLVASIVEVLLCVALPIVVGLRFIGADLLVFVYRDPDFADAALALSIVTVGMVASSFNRPLALTLVANGFERVNVREGIISGLFGGLIAVALISRYQLIGAAITLVVMNFTGLSIYGYAMYKHLFSFDLWRLLRRPLLVAGSMLLTFLVLQQVSQDLLLTMVYAIVVYGLLLAVLGAYAVGGPSVAWSKLAQIRRKT